jgi:hypothetical protein
MSVDRSPSENPRRVRLATAIMALPGASLGVPVLRAPCQHNVHLAIVLHVVQVDHDAPAVHLPLIQGLSTVIQAARVAQSDGVGSGKQAKRGMRFDDSALVEQREPALDLEHALNHEHHVRASSVILVEDERARTLKRPREHAGLELRDLLAVTKDDGVLADEIHA